MGKGVIFPKGSSDFDITKLTCFKQKQSYIVQISLKVVCIALFFRVFDKILEL